jgi:hypothetical protein
MFSAVQLLVEHGAEYFARRNKYSLNTENSHAIWDDQHVVEIEWALSLSVV